MGWMLSREVVIALALLGAVASTLASVLQARGSLGGARAKRLNVLGYGFMGASVLLFILAGLLGPSA